MNKITKLEACTLSITNNGKKDKNINIYVSNRDCMPYKMSAGDSFTVTTSTAGETYFYLSQATDELVIEQQ